MLQFMPVFASTIYDIEKDLVISIQGKSGIGKSTLLTKLLQMDKTNNFLYVCDDPTFYYEKEGLIFATRNNYEGNVIQYRESPVDILEYSVPDEKLFYQLQDADKPLGLVINLHKQDSNLSRRSLNEYLSSEYNSPEIIARKFNMTSNEGWMHQLQKYKIPVIDLGIVDKSVQSTLDELSELLLSPSNS